MVPVIAAAIGAFGAFSSYKAQKKAAKQQSELTNQNVRAQRAETERQAKVLGEKQAQEAGRRRAVAGASGAGGKTQTAFLDAQDKIEEEEMGYLKAAGKSKAAIIGAEGAMMASASKAKAKGSLFDMAGSIAGGAGAAGSIGSAARKDWHPSDS